MKILSRSVTQTLDIGKAIGRAVQGAEIVCLFGDLGSGKTVLTKGIAAGLGVKKTRVVSPSFVLIREYHDGVVPLFHFDLYRLADPEYIMDLGYEDYLFDRGVTVIEWAERLGYLLPKQHLRIDVSVAGEGRRNISIRAHGRRYVQLLRRIDEDLRD